MIIPEDMTRMSLDAPASIEEAAALGYRVIASRTAVPDMVQFLPRPWAGWRLRESGIRNHLSPSLLGSVAQERCAR